MRVNPQIESMKKVIAVNWLVLFTSSATLICCAIPALLVSLGYLVQQINNWRKLV